MHTYFYNGPVIQFNNTINESWSAKTKANSPQKAISNLIFRYKKEHGYTSAAGGFKLDISKLSHTD